MQQLVTYQNVLQDIQQVNIDDPADFRNGRKRRKFVESNLEIQKIYEYSPVSYMKQLLIILPNSQYPTGLLKNRMSSRYNCTGNESERK